MGHSFGGSTAFYTGYMDARVTGAVVGLDPCVYVLPYELSSSEHP